MGKPDLTKLIKDVMDVTAGELEIVLFKESPTSEMALVNFTEFDGTPRQIRRNLDEGPGWKANDVTYYNRQKEADRQTDINNHLLTLLVKDSRCPGDLTGFCISNQTKCTEMQHFQCWKKYLSDKFPEERGAADVPK
jgi:hypothetical protein